MMFNSTSHKQLSSFFANGTIVVIKFWKTNKNAGNIKHVCHSWFTENRLLHITTPITVSKYS